MAQFSVDIHLYPRVYQPVLYCIRVQNKNISTIGRVLKKKNSHLGLNSAIWFKMNYVHFIEYYQYNDQLPVSLLAQLVEHCTCIAEVMHRPEFFFRPYFHYCSSSVHCCEDRFHINFLHCSSHIWFSSFQSHLYQPLTEIFWFSIAIEQKSINHYGDYT